MTKPNNISDTRIKVDDEIQFVPNLSSVEGDGLQMWMDALRSGKDVHCNLTTEDGYITITLVDDAENGDKEAKKKEITNLGPEHLKEKASAPLEHNGDSQNDHASSVEWGLFCNSDGNIVAHPVKNDFPGEGLKKQMQENGEDNSDIFDKSDNSINKESHSSRHTVIVTVASDDFDSSEDTISDSKCTIADPSMFPCIRNEWYRRQSKKPCSNFDEINTIALASDLRNFLRHHGISLASFSKKHLDRSQGSVSDLLNHPKPWSSLKTRGRSLYIKMIEFLSSENLHSFVEELSVGKVRQGPPTAKLPDYFLEMLAKKMMPPTKVLLKIAQENKLNVTYLKSYCVNQLKQPQNSVDVVVEFGDGGGDTSIDDLEIDDETPGRSYKEISVKSGFTPAFKDKQICPVLGCGYILSTRLTLKTHLLTHFGQKPHKCKLCEKSFRTLSNLRCHELRHKKELKLSKRARNAAFLREKEIVARRAANDVQMFSVNHQKEIKKPSKLKESSVKRKEAKKSSHACGVCFTSFSSGQLLQSHVVSSHPSSAVMQDQHGTFSCQVCKQSFKAINDLIVHQKSHEDSFFCKFCSKRFSGTHNCSRQYEIIRMDPKSYECSRCSAKFSDAHVLDAHMRLHTGKKPFTCETCGKQFTQRSTLLSHRLLHTDEMPFLCATCGKGFRQKTNLRLHEQRHRAEKTHTCETCKQLFVTKHDMQRHMWKHSKEHRFVCSKCSISYSRLNYLNEHVRKVHNILPYKCDNCAKGFSTKALFIKHHPCKLQMYDNKAFKETLTKTRGIERAKSSNDLLVPVLPDAVCCISSSSGNAEAELVKNPQLPVAMPTEMDPIFLPTDSTTSFPLSTDANMPVAIVTDRGFVLTSSKGVDPTLLESNVSVSNESLELLSKIPTPQADLGESIEDQSDFTLHSTNVSKELN